MFALGIQYLNGWVTAADVSDRSRVEWPPHPGRVFMAMAHAYFTSGRDGAERAALEWLEALAPPSLSAGQCEPRSIVKNFVPVNDKAGEAKAVLQSAPGITRTRQPRTFARAWLENDSVHLLWPEVSLPVEHEEALERVLSRVSRIGHSSSFVQMWLEHDPGDIHVDLVPSEHAERHLRVIIQGTLEYLEACYNAQQRDSYSELVLTKIEADTRGQRKAKDAAEKQLKEVFGNKPPVTLRPELSCWQGYAEPRAEAPPPKAVTVFDDRLLVYKLVRKDSRFRVLELATTLQLTSALRGSLIKAADGELPERIIGHRAGGGPSDGPHLAMLPLAFVGSEHADGKLLGLALALPRELARSERSPLLAALATATRSLVLGALGTWQLEAIASGRPAYNLRADSWTASRAGSSEWGTVTPIALDRHAKASDPAGYRAEVARHVADSCERVTKGIRPREVVVLDVSPHSGVPHSHAFPRCSRKDKSLLRHTHALLVFDEPIIGPLAIGAGRYRGYGFCRPLI